MKLLCQQVEAYIRFGAVKNCETRGLQLEVFCFLTREGDIPEQCHDLEEIIVGYRDIRVKLRIRRLQKNGPNQRKLLD